MKFTVKVKRLFFVTLISLVFSVDSKVSDSNSLEDTIKKCNHSAIQNINVIPTEQSARNTSNNPLELSYKYHCFKGFVKFSSQYNIDFSKFAPTDNTASKYKVLSSFFTVKNFKELDSLIKTPNELATYIVTSKDKSLSELKSSYFEEFRKLYTICIKTSCTSEIKGYASEKLIQNIDKYIALTSRFEKLELILAQGKKKYNAEVIGLNKRHLSSLRSFKLSGFTNYKEKPSELHELSILKGEVHLKTQKLNFGLTKVYQLEGEVLLTTLYNWYRKIGKKIQQAEDESRLAGQLYDVRKDGDYYYASHRRQIVIYDKNLKKVSAIDNPIPKGAHIIQVLNNKVYALDNEYAPIFIFALDISDKKKPIIIPHLTITWAGINAHLVDQWIIGNAWYVLGRYSYMNGYGYTLSAFNLTTGIEMSSGSLGWETRDIFTKSNAKKKKKVIKILSFANRYPEQMLCIEYKESDNISSDSASVFLAKPVIEAGSISLKNRVPVEIHEGFYSKYPYLKHVKEFEEFYNTSPYASIDYKAIRVVVSIDFITFFGPNGIQINEAKSGKLLGFYPALGLKKELIYTTEFQTY